MILKSEWLDDGCYDLHRLPEDLEDAIGGTYSAARFLTVVQGADPEVVEAAFVEMEQYGTALDISTLPPERLYGSDALRLKQEAEFDTLEQITTGLEENDPLVLYLQELAAVPVCGDVQLLAADYRSGNGDAAEKLLQLCLGMVAQIALEFTGHGVLLMDLIQEGNMGLWESIPRYKEGDFLDHARWWIRQYMAKAVFMHAFENDIGRMIREDMNAYVNADRQLLAELGRNPTRGEIAEHLGMTLDELAVFEKLVADAKKDAAVKKQKAEPEKTPDDDQAVEDTAYFQLRQRVTELLSALPEQEAKLLTLRFGLEGGKALSPEETGRQLGLTPAQVVALEAAALAKLRKES